MNEDFLIYIDRLKNGKEEIIHKSLNPSFIAVEEKDLHFKDKVDIDGKAYLVDDHLLIQLKITTFAAMPCSVCNQDVKLKIEILDFNHVEEIADIKSHIYDYSEVLRENILLAIPQFVECEGNCPERKNLSEHLKAPNKKKAPTPSGEGQHFPFANL